MKQKWLRNMNSVAGFIFKRSDIFFSSRSIKRVSIVDFFFFSSWLLHYNTHSWLHASTLWFFCWAPQEFADNLQGKGVHGALIALDPSFDTDAMAKALGIPNNKQMLHRHLYEEMKSLSVPPRCAKMSWIAQLFNPFLNLKLLLFSRNALIKTINGLICFVSLTVMRSRTLKLSAPPSPRLSVVLLMRGCHSEEQERYHLMLPFCHWNLQCWVSLCC